MKKSTKTIRALAVEVIDKANSGHPGIALGAAPIMNVLFSRVLNVYSADPKWINRDRFVLSAGHGSSLLYVMLHLSGFKVTIDDLKQFRTLGSLTPGHPEYLDTEGVEVTTGPLGQGVATSVGMAISEAHLHALYPNEIDHYTFSLCGEGDLEEGISYEAMSLAGHLKLNKLIWILDSNSVQLDGPLSDAFSENIKGRFAAANWDAIDGVDGENEEEIYKAIVKAKTHEKPTLIIVKTTIGKGSVDEGTSKVHGSPLKKEEVLKLRESAGGKPFTVSEDVYSLFKTHQEDVKKKYLAYTKKGYSKAFKELLASVDPKMLDDFPVNDKPLATRNLAGEILNKLTLNPKFIGGSADLSSSTKVKGNDGIFSLENRKGRDLKFGVREHAMAAIANGIKLHGVLSPFVSGFFVFSDYLKPAIRLSSLMNLSVLYLFTHDSIGVGEDGPTHQPVEQISMLRSQPNTLVLRPGSFYETVEAFKLYLKEKEKPVVILLTRQNIDNLAPYSKDIEKGGYVVRSFEKEDGVLIASGSEVDLAIKASETLQKEHNLNVRVVSMMSVELFLNQSIEYKEKVLPETLKKRMVIEMSDGIHLEQFKRCGKRFAKQVMTTFGASGSYHDLCEKFGFTVSSVVDKYLKI